MTFTNGDVNASSVPLLRNTPPLDYTTALEVLENEYPNGDGIDVYTLLDSTKHGALTYNDFLILPGYIGMDTCFVVPRVFLMVTWQVLPRQRSRSIHQ
jgi:IMP dehydrogenase